MALAPDLPAEEAGVWERIELPALYYAHERDVVERDGMLLAITEWSSNADRAAATRRRVRYRTVGDAISTGAVESDATDADAVLAEVTLAATDAGIGPVFGPPITPGAVADIAQVTALPRFLAGFLVLLALGALARRLTARPAKEPEPEQEQLDVTASGR